MCVNVSHTQYFFFLVKPSVEAVSILVELGANVNAQNNLTGASPLHMVAQSHKASIDARLKVAEILLDSGALPDLADNYGSMPINLLESTTEGTDLDEKTKLLLAKLRPRQPKIHQAIIDRDLSLLESLLSDSAIDVHESFQSIPPLSLAIRTFLEDIATTETPHVHDAADVTLSMIRALLNRGADPNCLIVETTMEAGDDAVKDPALHKVVCTLREIYRKKQDEAIGEPTTVMVHNLVKLLISTGAKVPTETTLLLHQAARLNECLLATFLLDQLRIDPNTKGRQGMTPLHFAARSGKLEMLVSTVCTPVFTKHSAASRVSHRFVP